MTRKIPVTVLTGFLGSGKTTLLNRILSEDHGMRIAVIENEFGEIGIDQDLVINADEEVFEMNNGCICCNVRGDLIRILGEMASRLEDFDRVILETTGMADPAPVAQTFLVQEDIQDFYQLDGIVTLVDGKHVDQHLDDETDEVLAQVAFADRIIINKIDLITEEEKRGVKRRLQSMNSMAGFYEATMADAPVAELLDIGGFNVERAVDIKPTFLEPEYPFVWAGLWDLPAGNYRLQLAEVHNHHDHDQGHDHQHDHHDHQHDKATTSIVMVNPGEASGKDQDTLPTLAELAESVFVSFSADAQDLAAGQVMTEANHHYRLNISDEHAHSEQSDIALSLDNAQTIALFTGHTPGDRPLALLAADGSVHAPKAHHDFHGTHSHDSKVSSTSVELPGKFDGAQLNAWLEEFLQENGPDVYRLKGVVGIAGQDYRFVFQGVHMIFGSEAVGEWGDETPINRLVFIGKNLDEPYIRKSLENCLAG